MKDHDIPFDFLTEDKKKILIIDDEPALAVFLQKALQEIDSYSVETANSGFSAGLKLAKTVPDVILLDILLGDMDGREFFEHLHQNPEYVHVKVIGMSGNLSWEEIAGILKQGFDEFLEKPINLKKLYDIVRKVLKK